MQNILFICSQNRLRSPTAEQIFSTRSDINVSSAGLNHHAENPLTPDLVEWANMIFVMEKTHRKKLNAQFKKQIKYQKIICLNIPDEFEFMDEKLIDLLNARVLPHLPILSN